MFVIRGVAFFNCIETNECPWKDCVYKMQIPIMSHHSSIGNNIYHLFFSKIYLPNKKLLIAIYKRTSSNDIKFTNVALFTS